MDNVLRITQALGAPLIVRTVSIDKRYDNIRQVDCPAGEHLVEFYDASFIKEPGYQPYGQYIGRYCKSKLSNVSDQDLIINSRVPQWFVEKENLTIISNWLRINTN